MSDEIKKEDSTEAAGEPQAAPEIKETPAAPEAEAPVAAAPAAPAAEEARPHPAARIPRFKRKGCKFCQNKNLVIDYKNVEILERFITERGKILPRRITGTCSKHQRGVALAIKQARIIALLPFIVQ
jgi:small subunit ribosomal protein S18